MQLVAATLEAPIGLRELLDDVGDGESGFGGTPVHGDVVTVEEYLRTCCDMPDPAKLRPGYGPQTVFWALDDTGRAVGMARVRHYLNDALRAHGGHVGYFVHSGERGRGYGKAILRLALVELKALGESEALLTVDSHNVASIRVIEANGGRLAGRGVEADGVVIHRYTIDLATGGASPT